MHNFKNGRLVKKAYLTSIEKYTRNKILTAQAKESKRCNKCKQCIKNHLKRVKHFLNSSKTLKVIDNSISISKLMMTMKKWKITKIKDDEVFTFRQKIIALSLFKLHPQSYKFLANFFRVPSIKILFDFVKKCNQPGVSEKVCSSIVENNLIIFRIDQVCAIIFDDIKLRIPVTKGSGKTVYPRKWRTYNIRVYMLQWLSSKNYKLIACKIHSCSQRDPKILAKELKKIINDVHSTRMIVVATVCSQSYVNRHALKLLMRETQKKFIKKGIEPRDNIFAVNDKEIIPLINPAHLMRGMRNIFLKKDIKYMLKGETKIASWPHLLLLHEQNIIMSKKLNMTLLEMLTEDVVVPTNIKTKNIVSALQLFSYMHAGYMLDMSRKSRELLPTECENTAMLLFTLDNAFDSLSGNKNKEKREYKPLLRLVKRRSIHNEKWTELIEVFHSMECVPKTRSISIENWTMTLQNAKYLVNKLFVCHNFRYLWMGQLSLEKLDKIILSKIRGRSTYDL